MTCEEIVLLLSEYTRNQLDDQEREQVETHLPDCPACQEELMQTEHLQAILEHGQATLPESTQDLIVTRIMEGIVEPPVQQTMWQRLTSWIQLNRQAAMAFGVLVVVVGIGAPMANQFSSQFAQMDQGTLSSEVAPGGQTAVPMAAAPEDRLRNNAIAGEEALEQSQIDSSVQPHKQDLKNQPALNEGSLRSALSYRSARSYNTPTVPADPKTGGATTPVPEAEQAKKSITDTDKPSFKVAQNSQPPQQDILALEPNAEKKRKEEAATVSREVDARMVAPHKMPPMENQANHANFLIRQSTLSIEVKAVDKAFQTIEEIVDKSQGYITSATLNQPQGGQATADLQIKIPRKFLVNVSADLDHLGSVRQKTIRTEDIWQNYQQQQIEIADRQARLKQTTKPEDKLALQKQLSLEKMEKMRLQQMLQMATIDIHLSEAAVSQIWNLQQTWNSILQQLVRSGRETLLMLTAIVAFIPPLLVYLLVGYGVARILRHVVVGHLKLLGDRPFYTLVGMGLLYFPLYWSSRRTLDAVFSFALLMLAWWALKTLAAWWQQRQAVKQTPPSGE